MIKLTPLSNTNPPVLSAHDDQRTASVQTPCLAEGSENRPVIKPDVVRSLLNSIDKSTPCGLRDRALMGVMFYGCARVGDALGMRVEDFYTQNRRLWVRLGERRDVMLCGQTLGHLLAAYIRGAGLAAYPKGALFRADSRTTGELARTTMTSFNVDQMICHRTRAAGIGTRFSGHSFRIGGIAALAERKAGLPVK